MKPIQCSRGHLKRTIKSFLISQSAPSLLARNEPLNEILQYLKSHGERLDTDIAIATGISLANVHLHLAELAAKREVMACHSIKFENGRKIEGISCRLTGYIPRAAPGRKSKAQLKLS